MSFFLRHRNAGVFPLYQNREGRNKFAADQIKRMTGVRSVLNLGGGGMRSLGKNLGSDYSVYEIDIHGDCDLILNLDSVNKLPFENNSFDLCCAFDVLEHLENFHLINDELLRVSRRFILLSLPNSGAEILPRIFKNNPLSFFDPARGFYSKFYGIPLVRPADRHRWWMYFADIVRYYYWISFRFQCSVEFWISKKSWQPSLARIFLSGVAWHNLKVPYVWIKLTKKTGVENGVPETSR
jgi:SAM-dependent methyltransferase